MNFCVISRKWFSIILLFIIAFTYSVPSFCEAFPTSEAFPSGESFPMNEISPTEETFPSTEEEDVPSGFHTNEIPEEVIVPNTAIQPRGSDEAEHIFAIAYSKWAASARSIRTMTGGTMLLDEKTPVYTLMASAAYRTNESAYLSSPGSATGLEQAASQLLGEMNANQQSLALELTAEKPFRGSFLPTGFILRLVQATYDVNGTISMDCAILTLTDAGGNPKENPAYAFIRFFGNDDVVCWISNNLQILQVIAQMNQIRTSGIQGLSLSPILSEDEAPNWSSIVKTAVNGNAYNPDTASSTGSPVNASATQFTIDTTDTTVGTFDTNDTYSTSGSFDTAITVTPEPTPSVQYVTVKEGVNAASIRESPTTKSRRIAMAYPGVQYSFLGVTDYSWIMINTPDGQIGYISPKLIGPLPGEENGPRIVVTKSMTIHEEPTYYSNEPSSVRAGHSYYVVNDQMGEWVQIRNTDGSIGYVNRKFIR